MSKKAPSADLGTPIHVLIAEQRDVDLNIRNGGITPTPTQGESDGLIKSLQDRVAELESQNETLTTERDEAVAKLPTDEPLEVVGDEKPDEDAPKE